MNKLTVAITLFFFTFCNNIYSQSQLSFTGLGGINYIPMKEFSNHIKPFSNSNFDNISFSANIEFKYRLIDNHHLYLSAEYISSNASLWTGFDSLNWIFQTVPVTLGYEYQFFTSADDFILFMGIRSILCNF